MLTRDLLLLYIIKAKLQLSNDKLLKDGSRSTDSYLTSPISHFTSALLLFLSTRVVKKAATQGRVS